MKGEDTFCVVDVPEDIERGEYFTDFGSVVCRTPTSREAEKFRSSDE